MIIFNSSKICRDTCIYFLIITEIKEQKLYFKRAGANICTYMYNIYNYAEFKKSLHQKLFADSGSNNF